MKEVFKVAFLMMFYFFPLWDSMSFYSYSDKDDYFKLGYQHGYEDAVQERKYFCKRNRCRSSYARGYKLGYRGGAKRSGILIDSPAKTFGSDFNGDGISDIIVGAQGNDSNASGAGAAYVFFGASGLNATYDVSSPVGPDFTMLGRISGDALGRDGISSAGDVNGDGIDDICVSASLNDDNASGAGAAYIFFGASNLSGTKIAGGQADVTFLGRIASDYLGNCSAGDVNGDGISDIIVGANGNDDNAGSAGAAYVFFGASNLSGTKTAGGQADVTFLGRAASDSFGRAVSSAGDVNGDGFDDVIVGAHLADYTSINNRGAAYIFFGSASLSGAKIAGPQSDVTILGRLANDYLSSGGVSSAGDVNGDGFDDVIVGAPGNDDNGASTGVAYIFFGSTSLSGLKRAGPQSDVTILGGRLSDILGRGPSSAGDVNDDGFDDVLVPAYFEDSGGNAAGAAYIFFGSASLSGAKIAGSQSDFTMIGRVTLDYLGSNKTIGTTGSVSAVGDVNNDGVADMIVGASRNDDGGGAAGAAYIFFGSVSISGEKRAGLQSDVTILGGTTNDYLGGSVGGGRRR